MEEIGIYIHIPFCLSKCFYCNFCSVKYDKQLVEDYINSLKEEILANSEILSNYLITSIYFGGGTPSIINEKYIKEILDILRMYNVSENAEITIEINPKTVNENILLSYYNSGINRISLGLQTIHDSTLKAIGRVSTFEDFKKTYDLVCKVGFNNISIDVITGLPGENIDMFNDTLNYIFSLKNLRHISCYSLEVHENTKLDFLLKENYLQLPDEDEERKMKHLLDKVSKENGFIRYEISNYAKEGFKSRHNTKYWTEISYLGFGVSAASYINNTRYSNTDNIDEYIKNIQENLNARKEIEELDLLDEIKEYIILRLRLKEGINVVDFKNRFKKNIDDIYKQEINKLVNEKLLIRNKDNIYLSDKGEDLANIVWQEFI